MQVRATVCSCVQLYVTVCNCAHLFPRNQTVRLARQCLACTARRRGVLEKRLQHRKERLGFQALPPPLWNRGACHGAGLACSRSAWLHGTGLAGLGTSGDRAQPDSRGHRWQPGDALSVSRTCRARAASFVSKTPTLRCCNLPRATRRLRSRWTSASEGRGTERAEGKQRARRKSRGAGAEELESLWSMCAELWNDTVPPRPTQVVRSTCRRRRRWRWRRRRRRRRCVIQLVV